MTATTPQLEAADLIQPNIGLDSDVRHSGVEILNNTLANEAVLTLKTAAPIEREWAGFLELNILSILNTNN